MAETVVLPQQGNSVESVILLEWKVAQGDTVAEGDILCEVETDKATMEVESTASGTVLRILADAGDEVEVKTPIVVIGAAGETVDEASLGVTGDDGDDGDSTSHEKVQGAQSGTAPTTSGDAVAAERSTGIEAPATAAGHTAASPRARMTADERGVDVAVVTGTGPGGRIIERDVAAAAALTTGSARGRAAGTAVGTALGGRVGTADLAAAAASAPSMPSSGGSAAAAVAEEIAVTGVRRVIAERMHASLQETAQLTLHASADARAIRALRSRMKSADESLGLTGVNLNDMVMYAAVRTLERFPALNAHFTGETIRRFSGVDLGFAVDTPRGLLVPTIQGAHGMSLRRLSARTKELAGRAVEGKAGPDDLAPATFTVTNLGAFGIERFTPVLNPPQVAILGVGSIELKAVEGPDGIEHVPHIGLSLTVDHQAVDGAPGARFLKALAEYIAAFDLTLAL